MNITEIDDRIMKYIPKSKQKAIRACWHDSDGYWIELHNGYNADRMDWHCHTIHEDTIAELRYQIAGIGIDKEYWEELKMSEENANTSRMYQHNEGPVTMLLQLEKQDRFTSIFLVFGHDHNGQNEYLVAIKPTIDEENGTVNWRTGSLFEGAEEAYNRQEKWELSQRKQHYSQVYSTISKAISASNYDLYRYDLNAAYNYCLQEQTAEDIRTAVALYLKDHSWDGRISKSNSDWAKEQLKDTLDDKIDRISSISTHPTLINGFADTVRKKQAEEELREVHISQPNKDTSFLHIQGEERFSMPEKDTAILHIQGKDYTLRPFNELTIYGIDETDNKKPVETTLKLVSDSIYVEAYEGQYQYYSGGKIDLLELRLQSLMSRLSDIKITEKVNDLERLETLINDWFEAEHDSPADFSDMRHVHIAYTTDPETEEPIQVYADLEKLRIVKLYDDVPVSETSYENAYDMGDVFLNLDFDELVALTDKEEEKARKIDSDKASHGSFLPPIIKNAFKNVLDDEKSEGEIIYPTADNGRK